jgi:hypothetical protein
MKTKDASRLGVVSLSTQLNGKPTDGGIPRLEEPGLKLGASQPARVACAPNLGSSTYQSGDVASDAGRTREELTYWYRETYWGFLGYSKVILIPIHTSTGRDPPAGSAFETHIF